jgi:hypothetical protein
MIGIYGLVALFAGAAGLISGDVPGGRAVAVFVLLDGLAIASCAVVALRVNRVRLPAVVIGLILASFQASFDQWIFTGSRGFRVDIWPLAMLASLAIAWLMTLPSVSAGTSPKGG